MFRGDTRMLRPSTPQQSVFYKSSLYVYVETIQFEPTRLISGPVALIPLVRRASANMPLSRAKRLLPWHGF